MRVCPAAATASTPLAGAVSRHSGLYILHFLLALVYIFCTVFDYCNWLFVLNMAHVIMVSFFYVFTDVNCVVW